MKIDGLEIFRTRMMLSLPSQPAMAARFIQGRRSRTSHGEAVRL